MLKTLKSRLKNIAGSFNACLNNGISTRRFSWPAWTSSPVFKKLQKTLLYSLLSICVIVTILLCFALDNSPQTIVLQGLNRDDIQRAKQLLHVAPEDRESLKTVSLNQKDLNIAASYLLNHFV